MTLSFRVGILCLATLGAAACGGHAMPFGNNDGGTDAAATGGSTGTGGGTATGGSIGSGGATATGGSVATGGTTATGGSVATGGTTATGGSLATGGTTATGGKSATGGSNATGGTIGTGGTGSAGRSGTGGTAGSGGAGRGGAGGACQGLNQSQCTATAGCTPRSCPACSGGTMFSGCFASSGPIDACPPLAGCPVNCAGLTEAACRATTGCRADTCPLCAGGTSYSGCSAMVSTPLPCPAIACPIACSQVTTLADCDARTDCHSVFFDSQLCGCASVGCCAHFQQCAAGDKAQCKPSAQFGCTVAEPHCEGPYVVSYTASCYEGCARMTDCAP